MNGQPDWSRGYPVGSIYPAAWHSFQSPAHLAMICRLCGVRWDVDPLAPLSIAEIGCGTGYTAGVLAAGNPSARVLGIDYNPAHIAEARDRAARSGLANVRYIDADLAEMGNGEVDDLPEFDLITVHGVWSWVSDLVRQGILRIIGRRLRPGGIVFLSYNSLPGAASAIGLARLVRGELRKSNDPIDGIRAARTTTRRLMEAKAPHLAPSSWRRMLVEDTSDAKDLYLVHELETEHWRPCFFADVAEAMSSVRCDYVGSATLDENYPGMSLDQAHLEMWEAATSQAERQLLFDFCVARAFRRDVFVRGMRRVDRESSLDAITMVAATHGGGDLDVATQRGVATLPTDAIAALRDALVAGPRTIGGLRKLPACSNKTAADVLFLLRASGMAVPLWREPGTGPGWGDGVATARRFNAVMADELAPYGIGTTQMGLASPAIAGGIVGNSLDLAVATIVASHADAVHDADLVCAKLLPPGPSPDADVLDELRSRIEVILRDKVPAWAALGIC